MPEDERRRPGRGFGGAALAASGLINTAAVAGGASFGPIRGPVLRRTYAVVRD